MKIRGIIITTVMILAIIAVSTTTAAALSCSGDICVDPTGWQRDGGAFNANATAPIQAAVDDANMGETICVAAGSYNENVNIATPHLTLRGEGAGVATVTAANSGDHVFEVTADYVNITGFTVTGATIWLNAGICLDGADHCNISENNCSNNRYGIWLGSSNNNALASNIANSNSQHGIWLRSSSNHNTLTSNIVNSNNYGIHLFFSSDNTLTSNTASNNQHGIELHDSSNTTLTSNTADSNNDSGIDLYDSSNNTFESNTANSNSNYGIWLRSSSNNNTLLNNTANSNNDSGIWLCLSSNNNTLMNNTANSNNDSGIWLYSSCNYNTLVSNTASNNWHGIYIDSSRDNDVTCNLVQNNTDCGIYLTIRSTGNNITWNNIVTNGELQTDGSYYYQFNNSQFYGVDAINNFWGTGMNSNTIDASIYDDEEGKAEVEFYPFATEPAPCAPAPIPEESPAFTTADALIALRIAVGSCPTDLHWDVSGDGQVTSLDALMITMDSGT